MNLDYIRSFAGRFREARLEGLEEFLAQYEAILRRDEEVPIFSTTEKYKSFPKKHFKRGLKKGNMVIMRGRHRLFTPKSDLERIMQVVRGTLNKINEGNFESQIDSLKRSLVAFNSVETLDILTREIVAKVVFENKFQSIYAQLCTEVVQMVDWQDQLVTVVENDGELYWTKNFGELLENTVLHGPFATEDTLRIHSRSQVNFLATLLEGLRGEFERRTEYWERYIGAGDEVEQYRAKRAVLAPLEFIVKLAGIGLIPESLFHYVALRSLRPKGGEENEYTVDAFLHLWREVEKEGYRPNYVDVYKGLVTELLARGGWPNRIRFMLEDGIKVAAKGPARDPPKRSLEERLADYFRGGELEIAEGEDATEAVIYATLDTPSRLERAIPLVTRKGVEQFLKGTDMADLRIDFPKAPEILGAFLEGS